MTHGAVLLFHDASSETSLEQRCQSLHEKATKDALTQVANRAEFDRVHAMFVATHQQQQVPCSLLMCDLDRFKLVNDNYGHQAGDDVIKSLASLLKSSCRPGDLVARYGGEEFVVLCADCDNASAARRAKQVCKALGQTPAAENGRPGGDGQHRRHRGSARRHAGDDAPPRRPRLVDGQGRRPQHRHPAWNRHRRRDGIDPGELRGCSSPPGPTISSSSIWSRRCR